MTTNAEPLVPATPLLFVYAYHNLPGISDGEWLAYYNPRSLKRLRGDLRGYVQHQLNLFSKCFDFEDAFSQAEYVEIESIGEDEVVVFRSALRLQVRDVPLDELHPRDQLNGLRAVVLLRIDEGNLDGIRSGLDLFDNIMESGIPTDDARNPRSYIWLKAASEFAPWFIDSLLESIASLKQQWGVDSYRRFVGERFEPLKPLLDKLDPIVHREGWPRNDLALGEFLLIVDYFRQVVEDWSS
jgi:hypothetical protein